MAVPSANEDKMVKETLRLIDKGWEQLNSKRSNHGKRDVTFVLGGTGAGKSTATQIVTGHIAKLHAKRHRTGYVIVDEIEEGNCETAQGRIGDPQVSSKTFLPEYLSCDDDSTLVFVDCPGFNDNRGAHIDIAAMVLIKKIAEQVDNARFLFVIPSTSVSYSSMNRNDFLLLTTHATSFFKNLNKVKDSMGLIITKVHNRDPSSGEIIGDKTIIEETTEFLMEASRQPAFKTSHQFIEYLLRDEAKWALIRYPTEPGPLNNMEHFVEIREQIRDMCKTKLKSAAVTPEDFAITLSPESKYVIVKRLIPHMKGEIDRLVTAHVTELKTGFVTKFQAELLGLRGNKLVGAVNNLEEICNKLRQQEKEGQDDILPVTRKVNRLLEWLQISLPEQKIAELKKVEEQLNLFQQVTDEVDVERGISVQITNSFNSLRTKLEDLHKSTLEMLKDNNVRNVEAQIKEKVHQMLQQFKKKHASGFWNSLENGDEYGRQALEKLQGDWVKFESLECDGFEGKKLAASAILKLIGGKMELELDGDSLKTLEELENELEMLLELTGQLNRSGTGVGSNIFPEIRTALNNLRGEAQQKVRDQYVQLVREKIQKQTDSLFRSLEGAFFQERFYQNMNMDTMVTKGEMLVAVRTKTQQLRGSFTGVQDGVDKAFEIFDVDVPETEISALGKYETLLNFYDDILGNPIPRPLQDWMNGLRLLQERIQEMERLYEFMFLAKNSNPLSIEQDLLGGDVEATISKFFEAFRATSDIRQIVQQRGCAEEKLLIHSIATYLENEKAKLKAETFAVATCSTVESSPESSQVKQPLMNEQTHQILRDVISVGLKMVEKIVDSDDITRTPSSKLSKNYSYDEDSDETSEDDTMYKYYTGSDDDDRDSKLGMSL